MEETWNPDLTQPLAPANNEVRYRCTCGTETVVSTTSGGICPKCDLAISPKTLQHDLAMTMTIASLHGDSTQEAPKSPTVPAKDDDLIGQILGHFEIIAPLGRGGMGQVYQALDKSLQRYVAVKVLLRGQGSSNLSMSRESHVDELLQEAVAQARVTHPNIVTIYYVGKQDGNSFLAMELVNGIPMNQVCTDHGLEFAIIGPVALQVAEALRFSYELDIIHGDIKPSNIILQQNGNIKLSDFGMARRVSDQSAGRIGGTPNYIAPELLDGKQPSIHSDMYALGVTLYELTFGQLPVKLTGNSIPDWITIHQTTEIEYPQPWPEHLPETWKSVLERLLAPNPTDRFGSYEELIEELDDVQPGSKVGARRVPRFVAAGIDFLSVLMLMGTLDVGVSLLAKIGFIGQHAFVTNTLHLMSFLPMLVYTLILMTWRQSIGRALMHVRVVNEYQLVPSPKTMFRRSLFRMSFLWAVSCMDFLGEVFQTRWILYTGLSVVGITAIYMLICLVFLFANKTRKTPHDLLLKTNVVLDTD